MQTQAQSASWVKISARIPKSILKNFTKFSANKNLSKALRSLMEREISREKVLAAHKKLYGRFKMSDFNASLL